MQNTPSYKSTIYACYLGHFVQAAIINAAPILFLTLISRYNLTFEKMGRLALINFITQVAVDLLFSRIADKRGVRFFIVAGHALAFTGLFLYALSAFLPSRNYLGFAVSTIVYSFGGGLLEVLLSPIVNAIPTPEKAKAMSLLHAFYAWGQLTVVLASSLLLALFGAERWYLIMLFWSILPLLNTFFFLKVPLAPMVPEQHRTRTGEIIKNRFFMLCLVCIMAGAVAENAMAQWASSFLEAAVGIPKIIGDYAGVGVFALTLGIGRTYYGKMSGKLDIYKAMLLGGVISLACFITAAFSPFPMLSLFACAFCGLGVSLLWPGTLVIAAEKFPLAGTSMFALLAAAGDIGAATGPWTLGLISDKAPLIMQKLGFPATQAVGMRAGFLAVSVFPLLVLLSVFKLRRKQKKHEPEEPS